MDKSQILVSVFLILLKCEESTMQNVTFYNTPQTWTYAANFCSHKGGVLESNVTLLKELDEFKIANKDVWIGKFETLTNWTYIQGCYIINGKFQHFKLERYKTLELECQMLCEKYQFYSIKEEDCYCIANISSFVRNTNCNCFGCYKVWEHQLPNFDSADEGGKCIAAKECAYDKLKRTYENCATSFYVTCDNGIELGYKHINNYHAAAEDCERRGSFIKWYSDSLCLETPFPEYWTSGTRYTETFLLRKPYFTENLQPEECYILRKNVGERKKDCNVYLRFFCNFETDEDKGDIISILNLSMSPKTRVQSDNFKDMIIGIGVSITVVILILVGIFFMIRRIRSQNLLSLSTIVKDEPSASRMDSNTVTAAYEQLNKTDKDKCTHCQSYDQLHSVNLADTVIKTNTRISIEEESKYESIEEPIEKYSNALTAEEYEQLEQTEIVNNTNVYDPLHFTPVEDDPTNARSNNIVSREEYRKYDTSQTENETDKNELTMQHIAFSYTKKSWKSAVNHCSLEGGVLESNITLLKELDEFKTTGEDVWIGKFKTLTNWTYIRGCYLHDLINGNYQHFQLEHSKTVQLQCQMLCVKYKFYSVKGADCYCIDEIDSFVRSKNCNCVGCYKVWEHQLADFGTATENSKCIATFKCDGQKFIRSYKECKEKYYVTCDNDVEFGYEFDKYEKATEECESEGSFIKWHSDNSCISTTLPTYWTSGTRHDEKFLIRKEYSTENIQPDKCFILKEENGKEHGTADCNSGMFFFCRFGDMIPPQNNALSDNSGSIAAGTVTSIIVVIVVISVLVFIYRRRLSRRKPTSHESQNNSRLQDTAGLPSNHEISKAPIYHEIDTDNFGPRSGKLNCSRTVNNITYDQAPNSKNMNQSENSSILTNLNSIEHQRKVGQTEYDMPKVINVTGNSSEDGNSSDYCLAEPITINTEEELDPYDINKDYDHLHNVKKKEDPITKVYDHLPTTVTDDPTYDHSNLKSALDNEDFYDHFKNEGDND